MTGIYLALGSNLGDRLMNLVHCLKEFKLNCTIEIIKVSSVYESEPYGFSNQPWFLNLAVEIETNLEPLNLLKLTRQIENRLGREKTYRWGPRIIDIDILSYKNIIVTHPLLNIPHRQLHLRQFVLQPLKEIATHFVHPELKKNIDQLLNSCHDQRKVNWLMDGNELLSYLK
jgi:2-amino-4-hydroxy-6-hydroxymethyldihydropteridine diphosphokinase